MQITFIKNCDREILLVIMRKCSFLPWWNTNFAKFVTGNAKNPASNKYIVLLEGATDTQPQLFNIKAVAVYPLQWNVEVTFKQTTKIVVKVREKQKSKGT